MLHQFTTPPNLLKALGAIASKNPNRESIHGIHLFSNSDGNITAEATNGIMLLRLEWKNTTECQPFDIVIPQWVKDSPPSKLWTGRGMLEYDDTGHTVMAQMKHGQIRYSLPSNGYTFPTLDKVIELYGKQPPTAHPVKFNAKYLSTLAGSINLVAQDKKLSLNPSIQLVSYGSEGVLFATTDIMTTGVKATGIIMPTK